MGVTVITGVDQLRLVHIRTFPKFLVFVDYLDLHEALAGIGQVDNHWPGVEIKDR